MTVPTLFVTGPVGVGKTSVAAEMLDVLEERGVPCAFFDLDAKITVVRLTAPLGVIHARLRGRERGAGLDWHLERAAELDAQWRSAPVEDLLVQTEGRTVRELANEILAAAGWV